MIFHKPVYAPTCTVQVIPVDLLSLAGGAHGSDSDKGFKKNVSRPTAPAMSFLSTFASCSIFTFSNRFSTALREVGKHILHQFGSLGKLKSTILELKQNNFCNRYDYLGLIV